MPLLTLDNACLAFGHVALLDHVALQIDAGERIALIGRNGCGKSSLMRVLAGFASLDDGIVWRQSGMRMAYVPQEPVFPLEQSVFETIAAGLGQASDLLLAYHEAAHTVALDASAANLAALQELQERLDHADGWLLHTRVEQAISRLGLDAEAKIATLSGGGIKRVALAQALASEPDLLLLDEPTNHLDLESITALNDGLIAFSEVILFASHDQEFVSTVANRIIDISGGDAIERNLDFEEDPAREGYIAEAG